MPGVRASTRDAEFTEFVQAAQPGLLRMAYALSSDPDSARDLVQQTLLKTYLAWGRVRREEATAYARRILVNTRIDNWRATRLEIVTDSLPERSDPDGSTRVGDRDRVVRLLANLPEQQRKVVLLRYYTDLPEAQVADLLGISVGAVKSAASRGLAALRTSELGTTQTTLAEGGIR
mgnify:CR=1 FL=1